MKNSLKITGARNALTYICFAEAFGPWQVCLYCSPLSSLVITRWPSSLGMPPASIFPQIETHPDLPDLPFEEIFFTVQTTVQMSPLPGA